MNRRALLGGMLGTALLAPVLAACGGASSAESGVDLASIKGFTPVGGAGMSAPSGSVVETDGSTWRYASPAADSITLLYFGYTSCPDVCPLTMADVAAALTRVPAEVRDRVWVQFVSTDPHRDTTPQIKRWLGRYDRGFHGGRAPIGQVVTAARAYGVFIKPPRVTRQNYEVTHGAQLFVLDPTGSAIGFFGELAGPSSYAQALPSLVQRYA